MNPYYYYKDDEVVTNPGVTEALVTYVENFFLMTSTSKMGLSTWNVNRNCEGMFGTKLAVLGRNKKDVAFDTIKHLNPMFLSYLTS